MTSAASWRTTKRRSRTTSPTISSVSIGADTVSKAASGGANAHQRLATALATSFDSLGGCDPSTFRDSSVRRRSDRPERPVRGAAVDRASRGGLWVRPWPRLGPPRISSRGKVAHYLQSSPRSRRNGQSRYQLGPLRDSQLRASPWLRFRCSLAPVLSAPRAFGLSHPAWTRCSTRGS